MLFLYLGIVEFWLSELKFKDRQQDSIHIYYHFLVTFRFLCVSYMQYLNDAWRRQHEK